MPQAAGAGCLKINSTPGQTLFAEELPTPEAAARALARFWRRKTTDYIISHDAPRAFVLAHFGIPLGPPQAAYYAHLGLPQDSRAHPAFVLDAIYAQQQRFGAWYFGHHHRDIAAGKMRGLYRRMALEDMLRPGV